MHRRSREVLAFALQPLAHPTTDIVAASHVSVSKTETLFQYSPNQKVAVRKTAYHFHDD